MLAVYAAHQGSNQPLGLDISQAFRGIPRQGPPEAVPYEIQVALGVFDDKCVNIRPEIP